MVRAVTTLLLSLVLDVGLCLGYLHEQWQGAGEVRRLKVHFDESDHKDQPLTSLKMMAELAYELSVAVLPHEHPRDVLWWQTSAPPSTLAPPTHTVVCFLGGGGAHLMASPADVRPDANCHPTHVDDTRLLCRIAAPWCFLFFFFQLENYIYYHSVILCCPVE
jgi:hypothetical protein